VVSILTRIWDGRSEIIIPALARDFFSGIHSLIQRVRPRVLPQGIKRHGRKADKSPPSSAEVKEVLKYTSSVRVKGGLELYISYTNSRKEGFSGK
jgi:hypothetical protein